MDTTPRPDLPGCAVAFIDLVVKKIRYRKKVRQEVRDELAAHFEDELRDCTDVEDRDRKAQQRIADFGDPKVLAALMRRAKKRCRPLWAKVAVHGLQAVGAMILYLVICSLPLMIGRPTIRVNYLDWVNNLVRAGQDEALNAKPYYDKAVELVAKAPDWPPELKAYRTTWPGDMNDRERKATAEFLDQSREALDTLREAVKKPSYWVRYQFSPEYTRADNQGHPLSFSAGLVDQATKPLAGRRDLIRRLELQCIWKTWNGDTDGALDDASALLRSGLHLQGKGTLVEQLVGISVEALANRQTLHVLTRSDTTAEDVKRIQDELDEFYAAQETVLSLDVEKALLLEYVQRTFTDDGKGNGRVLAHGIPLVTSDWKDSLAGLLLFRYPDRQETSKRIEDCYTTLERTMN
ncbi:MAG: hypothetical protein KBE04_12445, partial [Phycisphaerae bacterium]|nr:hypothetical protein [Phycisphaerae bacterium]